MWIYEDFGRRLKAARTRAHLSQQEVAGRVGLGRTSITNIEAGKQHFPLHLMWHLASAVGVQPEDLLPRRPRDEEGDVGDRRRRLPDEAMFFAERVALRAAQTKEEI